MTARRLHDSGRGIRYLPCLFGIIIENQKGGGEVAQELPLPLPETGIL